MLCYAISTNLRGLMETIDVEFGVIHTAVNVGVDSSLHFSQARKTSVSDFYVRARDSSDSLRVIFAFETL